MDFRYFITTAGAIAIFAVILTVIGFAGSIISYWQIDKKDSEEFKLGKNKYRNYDDFINKIDSSEVREIYLIIKSHADVKRKAECIVEEEIEIKKAIHI